ncbi:MAG TPA: hypothetical protein VMV45_03790 [Casimicrobiaceae bacterium]|nr:hypothetical protein [Casimicrobiaceae bacterium]
MATSASTTRAGARIAHRAELAWTFLRGALRRETDLALLVLDRDDWTRHAQTTDYGVPHIAQGVLVLGAEPPRAWHALSSHLAGKLAPDTLRDILAVHGPDGSTRGPALAAVAEALIAREVAHFVFVEQGCTFPRPWIAEAFACYAAVAVLGETDPRGLRLLGSLADAAATLDHDPCGRDARDAKCASACSVATLLANLQLTRGAYFAYAQAHVEPLRRVLQLARHAALPHNDRDLCVVLARRVHPSLCAIVHAACPIHDARAAA